MCCECLCYLVNVHIPSVLRTSSSSSWSVVVAAVALAGASAVDVCSLLLLILLLSPHTHHITNNSFQVVVIFVSVVLFWSPLQRGFYTDDEILKAFYANGWEQARNMVSRSQHSS